MNDIKKMTQTPKIITLGLSVVFIQFTLSLMALYYRAETLDYFVKPDSDVKQLLSLVILFSFFGLLNSHTDILKEYIYENLRISIFEKAWKNYLPSKILKPYIHKSEEFFESIYELIPNLLEINLERWGSLFYSILVLILYFQQIFQHQFWEALIILPIILLCSFLSTEFYKKSFQNVTEDIIKERPSLLKWIRRYFLSNREFIYNLKNNDNDYNNWRMNRGHKTALKLKRHNKITIYRDFLASFLNDLPYILTIASIIVISKLKGHGLASIIIWMGIVDYLVQASDSLKSFRDQGIEKKAILAQLEEQLSWVSKNENKCLKIKDVKKNKKLSSPKETFNLKDNGQITLSLNKGLWKIDGHNGSGKTTLWNTLIGYNVDYDTWSLKKVSLIQKELEGKVRIIEKSPGFVKEWSTFESQIMGFSSPEDQSNFWVTLEKKLDHLLPSKIGEQWFLYFKNLERLWKTRKNNEFSSGEQILFSLARVLYYFNKEVKVIISDECDSFLDKKTRTLYLETIRHFSKDISVWFISHTLGSKLEESV